MDTKKVNGITSQLKTFPTHSFTRAMRWQKFLSILTKPKLQRIPSPFPFPCVWGEGWGG